MKRNLLFLALACGVLVASPAMAASDLGFKRLGAAVGYVSPDNLDGTIGFGAFVDHGTITPRLGLESRVDYWSQSEEEFGAEASISDLTIGARAKYYFPVSSTTVRPFAGGGLGLHFLSAEVSIEVPGFPPMTAEDSSTEFGLDMGGGIVTALSPSTDLHGELWYTLSDLDQLSLRLGLSFKLGN